MSINADRGRGRIEFRADDPSLTPYAGLAVSGELCRRVRLVELIDAELQAVGRVQPVKRRRRGLSPGQLAVAIAEAQLAGAECFDDLEVVRADQAGAALRAVAAIPSAPAAGSWPAGSSPATSARSSGGWRARATSLTAGSVATPARL
jgi:hypothetical protein